VLAAAAAVLGELLLELLELDGVKFNQQAAAQVSMCLC
jgi:hypothetical protein